MKSLSVFNQERNKIMILFKTIVLSTMGPFLSLPPYWMSLNHCLTGADWTSLKCGALVRYHAFLQSQQPVCE